MKHIISLILIIAVLFVFPAFSETADHTISVVTTIFPEFDWVKQIIGENTDHIEVTLLLDNGVDLHSYQPTVDDMIRISTCDLFIYVGGESDEWVEDALASAVNTDMKVINLLDVLSDNIYEEEAVEGMEVEEEEEEEDAEEGVEYDEHVWLSLQRAQSICRSISECICEIDPEHKDDYVRNTENYIEALNTLDHEFKSAVENSNNDTLLFGDRFPFRYMVEDYGLNYYAAFLGCSAETEASFETIAFLSGKVKELGLDTILTLENSDQRIAQAIMQNSDNTALQILTMDSMQGTTSADVQNGASYLSIMEKNLSTLTSALK